MRNRLFWLTELQRRALRYPRAISGPTIVGTQTEGSTVNADVVFTSPFSFALTYAWKRDGVAIGGATASTYELVALDVGAEITVDVTATSIRGATTATSPAITPA